MRSLVVDACGAARARIARLLVELGGCTIDGEAADLAGALELLYGSCPELVIVDAGLSGGDGLRLIRAARAHPARPGVLVVSRTDSLLVRKHCYAAGADAFVAQTGWEEDFLEGLEAVARKRQHARWRAEPWSEELLRAQLDRLPWAAWITSIDGGRVEHVNAAAARLLGPAGAALPGRADAWLDAVQPEDRERAGHDALVRRSGALGAAYRLEPAAPGGAPRPVVEHALVLHDAGGRRERVLVVLQDAPAADDPCAALDREALLGRLAAVARELPDHLTCVDLSASIVDGRVVHATLRMEVLRVDRWAESAITLTQSLVPPAAAGELETRALVRRTLAVFGDGISSNVQIAIEDDPLQPGLELPGLEEDALRVCAVRQDLRWVVKWHRTASGQPAHPGTRLVVTFFIGRLAAGNGR